MSLKLAAFSSDPYPSFSILPGATMVRDRRHAEAESAKGGWQCRAWRCARMAEEKLVPVGVARADEHSAVHNGEDVDFVVDVLVYDAIWTAHCLAKAFESVRKRPETFFGDLIAKIGEWREKPYGLSEVAVPSAGEFACLFAANEPDYGHSLAMCVSRPFCRHLFAIPSSMLSISSKDSSSVRHSPLSNCLREMAIARASSAFSRHIAISSQVLSKSATLIITLVLRPFCVMTMGLWVRAVLAKQSLSVRRYSVNGTTSSSRRGRSIGLAFVRMADPPFQTDTMVHYSVPHVKGRGLGFQILKGQENNYENTDNDGDGCNGKRYVCRAALVCRDFVRTVISFHRVGRGRSPVFPEPRASREASRGAARNFAILRFDNRAFT